MEEKKNGCPCHSNGCERRGDCEKCREYHHAKGSKTACEK